LPPSQLTVPVPVTSHTPQEKLQPLEQMIWPLSVHCDWQTTFLRAAHRSTDWGSTMQVFIIRFPATVAVVWERARSPRLTLPKKFSGSPGRMASNERLGPKRIRLLD